jgi:dihydrofolate reductase
MKITLIFVSTVDGKITKWGNPDVRKWSSKDDKDHFRRAWEGSRLIVMGSNTYKASPPEPSSKRLIVVVTNHPDKYQEHVIPGQVEFKNELPGKLVLDLENEGYNEMLLVGGPQLATSFLRHHLVDELWLTIEPKIFGQGGTLATDQKLENNLRLISCEKLNEQGTLLVRYAFLKTNEPA